MTVVDKYETGILLQIDVSHRVLRTDTVIDVLKKIANKGDIKQLRTEAEKMLLGNLEIWSIEIC